VKSIVIKGDAGEKRISGSRLRDLFGLSTMMSTRMALTVTAEGKYVIEGRGYGHGVGLCQWGANGMAKSREGVTYIDILKHYYTGVEVTRMRSDESDTPSPLD
jgi:stage II sporulation protein D